MQPILTMANIPAIMKEPIRDIEGAMRWLDMLHDKNVSYHLDDDPAEIINVATDRHLFSPEVADIVRQRVAELHRIPMPDWGEHGDHHGYLLNKDRNPLFWVKDLPPEAKRPVENSADAEALKLALKNSGIDFDPSDDPYVAMASNDKDRYLFSCAARDIMEERHMEFLDLGYKPQKAIKTAQQPRF